MPHACTMVLALSLALSSSALSQRPRTAERSLAAAILPPGQVRLTYLGNAGWEITDGRLVIIVDPFVTQFASYPTTGRPTPRSMDDVLSPDTAAIDRRISRADYILVTHAHWDHVLDAPYIARKTGAVIVANASVANLARASNVSDSALITVRGGEDYEFGTFSLRVIPSLHSAILNKRYYTRVGSGEIPRGLKPPLRRGDYMQDGGTFAYLLRFGGQQILIMGGMNYIEREMDGLRPDVALIGAIKANGGTDEIYDYMGRLMRALGNPKTVLPTHLDAYGDPAEQSAIAVSRRVFADEVRRVSPKTRVILPTWFEPIVLGAVR
jgi:L-ascorbate metabolism protein UlaG (beta-lactamase superfamily)